MPVRVKVRLLRLQDGPPPDLASQVSSLPRHDSDHATCTHKLKRLDLVWIQLEKMMGQLDLESVDVISKEKGEKTMHL